MRMHRKSANIVFSSGTGFVRGLRHLLLHGALALALVACKPTEPPTEPLSREDAQVQVDKLESYLASHPDDQAAWRDLGHLYWIHLGDVAKARPILDRLADAGDPISLASAIVLADFRLDFRRARELSMRLIEVAKKPPEPQPQSRRSPGKPAVLDRGALMGFAAFAARVLARNHGEVPDDDKVVTAYLDKLSLEGYPVAVSQPLLSLRAQIARRHGEDYLSYYNRQGCLREWAAGPVEGTLAALELRHLEQDAGTTITADPDANVTPLSCVVRAWNPTPRAGVRRMQTDLKVAGNVVDLEIAAQTPMRIYVDGQLVYRGDVTTQWPADHAQIRVDTTPGTHRLEAHLTIPGERAWLMIRATDEQGKAIASGQPAKGKAKASKVEAHVPEPMFVGPRIERQPPDTLLRDPLYRPLRQFFDLADALAQGDSDRAEEEAHAIKAQAPKFADAHILVAAFEIEDPSRERTASAARQRAALEYALNLDNSLDSARIRLLEMDLERSEVAEVLEQLRGLPKGSLDHVQGELLRFRALLAAGDEHAALQALERAAARDPNGCQILKAQRLIARDRDDVKREDELVAGLERCSGTLGLRANLARVRGNFKQARELLAERVNRAADDVEAIEALADVAVSEQDYDRALVHLQDILKYRPYSAGVLLRVSDLQADMNRVSAARSSVERAIAKLPASSALRVVGENLGVHDDLYDFRTDGAKALAAYRQEQDPYPGANEVLVLDRSVARVYPDGSVRQIVHTISELRTKDAIDKYGEITPPEGARVLTLHSIKPDGTIVEPEVIPGKSGLSLRGLAPGDAVEYEFVLGQGPESMMPGYIDISRFRFQSADTPFHVSEMMVVSPEGLELKAESRHNAPKPQVRVENGLKIQHWQVKRSQRLGVEPMMRSAIDEVPSVRVFTPPDTHVWLESLALRLYRSQRTNPELRTKVAALTADIPRGPDYRSLALRAIYDWVLENIEETGDLSDGATLTLSAGKGSRLILLKTMLREAGIYTELWVGRDRFGPQDQKGGHPLLEAYAAPVLAVWVNSDGPKGPPVIVLTNAKVMPLGFIPVNLSGTKGVRIRLDDSERAPGFITFPTTPKSLLDRRSHKLVMELDKQGNGTVSGTIELQGMEALAWRNQLQDIDRARLNEGFERAELAHLFQGATIDLDTLELVHEHETGKPFKLKFQASIRGAAVRQGGDSLMRAATVPMNMALGYAQLPERKTGMAIAYAPKKTAEVTIRLTDGKFVDVPKSAEVKDDYGTYRREVTGQSGSNEITIKTEMSLTLGVIEPEDYPDLVNFARELKVIEDEIIRLR